MLTGNSALTVSVNLVQFLSSMSLPSSPLPSNEISACIPTDVNESSGLGSVEGLIEVATAKAENSRRIDRNASTVLICPRSLLIIVFRIPAAYHGLI